MVEKANHAAAQRFWRNLPDVIDGKPTTVEQTQTRLDTWCAAKGDARQRVVLEPDGTHRRTTVGEVAATEPLRPMPSPYPVTTTVERIASAQALVSYCGNFYSVPPELARAAVVVTVVHGKPPLSITPAASPTAVVARHRIVAAGTGATVRDDHHVSALNTAAMTAGGSETGSPLSPQASGPTRRDRSGRCTRAATQHTVSQNLYRRSGRARPWSDNCHRRNRNRQPGRRQQGPCRCCRPRTPRRDRGRTEHPAMSTTTQTRTPNSTSQASLYQQLRGHLATLKLHAAAEHLTAVLDHATAQGLSMTTALERLPSLEVEATEARRLAGRLRFASLPTLASIEIFNLDAAAGIDPHLLKELVTCRFIESATNVLLIGPPGVGKTHLAVALARKSVEAGYRTYFTTAADLAARCHRAAIEGRWHYTMRFFAGPTMLVIDELGYLPLSAEAASALFQVVSQRYAQDLDHPDHQPRRRVLGRDPRRRDRRRGHAGPAPAPLGRPEPRR